MEAGDRAAGDGHEQQRHQAGGALGDVAVDRGRGQVGRREQRGAVEQAQADEELHAVDVVARLQQHPDRQQRGDAGVHEQRDDPEGRRRHPEGGGGQLDRVRVAEQDQGVEGCDADDRGEQQVHPPAVDHLPDDQGHEDGSPSGDHRAGGRDQQVLDDDGEGRDHHEQQQEDHDEEQVAPARPDVAPREHPHRAAAVAGGGPQRAHVVHAGEEDGAERDPEERREPAPDHRDGRPDDRGGTGDRGEVVAPQHELVGRHEVDAVVHLVRRCRVGRVEPVDPLAEELRVEQVAARQHGEPDEQQPQRRHGSASE